MRKNLVFAFVTLAFTASCEYKPAGFDTNQRVPSSLTSPSTSPSPTPAPNPSGLEAKPLWEGKAADGVEWSAFVMSKLDTLGSAMLGVVPTDYATICPRYPKFSNMERKEFWTFVLSAIAKEESAFNTNEDYKENFTDSHGNFVISSGLLQISMESANGYGCGFTAQDQLHDPYLNLACGIRILNRWVSRDVRIAGEVNGSWKGAARYWSTMRSSNRPYAVIQKLVSGTTLCNPTAP